MASNSSLISILCRRLAALVNDNDRRALLWVHCRCVSDFDAPVRRDGPPGIAIVMSGPPLRVCGRFGTGGSSVAVYGGDTLVRGFAAGDENTDGNYVVRFIHHEPILQRDNTQKQTIRINTSYDYN